MLKRLDEERNEGRALRLALDIMWQATRHQRAATDYDLLIFDLRRCEEMAEELIDLLKGQA